MKYSVPVLLVLLKQAFEDNLAFAFAGKDEASLFHGSFLPRSFKFGAVLPGASAETVTSFHNDTVFFLNAKHLAFILPKIGQIDIIAP